MKELLESIKSSGNTVHVYFDGGLSVTGKIISVHEEYFTMEHGKTVFISGVRYIEDPRKANNP